MTNMGVQEDGALKVKGTDLYILPYYFESQKADPNIRNLFPNLESATQSMILSSDHKTGEIIETEYSGKSHAWLICLRESISNMALSAVLHKVLLELGKSRYRTVVIGLLGLIEFGCQNETAWRYMQQKAMEDFAKSHGDYSLLMVIPAIDYRPTSGRHLGEGILPQGNESDDDIPKGSNHHQIALNLREIKNYRHYFDQYIKARGNGNELIYVAGKENATIESVFDLQDELKDIEHRDKKENFSKWANKTKDKKTKREYYPVPSKQKLKLIILLLDMSYDEALACLNFFGYGLARFDDEDRSFAYILKNGEHWKRPFDVTVIDETLRHRFGAKAAIIAKQKGKGRLSKPKVKK